MDARLPVRLEKPPILLNFQEAIVNRISLTYYLPHQFLFKDGLQQTQHTAVTVATYRPVCCLLLFAAAAAPKWVGAPTLRAYFSAFFLQKICIIELTAELTPQEFLKNLVLTKKVKKKG